MSEVIDNLSQQSELKIGLPDPAPKPRPSRNGAHVSQRAEPPVDPAERDALRQEVERLKTELALREESMSQAETPAPASEYSALQREIEELQRTVADREADIAELRVAARLSAESPPAPAPRPDQQAEIARLTGLLEESGAMRRDLETQAARVRKAESGQKERIEALQRQIVELERDRDRQAAAAAQTAETNTRLEQDLKSAADRLQQREQQWDQVLREQDARERRLKNQMETAAQELAAVRRQLPEVKTEIQRETSILRARLLEEEQRAADMDAVSQRVQGRQTVLIAGAIVAALLTASLGFVLGRNSAPADAPVANEIAPPQAAEAPPVIPPPSRSATPAAAPAVASAAAPQPAWPAIAVQGVQARATPDSLTLLFASGVFSSGVKIDPRAQTALQALAKTLAAAKPPLRIEVQGCTDAQGSPARNRALAQQRADAVRDYLVRAGGLPAAAVSAAPAATPPFPGASPEADRKNRTVVLVVRRG